MHSVTTGCRCSQNDPEARSNSGTAEEHVVSALGSGALQPGRAENRMADNGAVTDKSQLMLPWFGRTFSRLLLLLPEAAASAGKAAARWACALR